jgi:ketosteroid isomerase-like protein
MKKLVMILSLVLVLCFAFGCQKGEEVAEEPVVDIEAEKANVKAVLNRAVSAYNALDAESYLENYCQDNDMVLFGDISRIVGFDAWRETIQKGFEQSDSAEVSYRDEVIKIHSSGEVSWLTCYLDLKSVSQGEERIVKGNSATYILEKRNGKSLIVHAHWSVPEAE